VLFFTTGDLLEGAGRRRRNVFRRVGFVSQQRSEQISLIGSTFSIWLWLHGADETVSENWTGCKAIADPRVEESAYNERMNHADRGCWYLLVRHTERIAEAGIELSVGYVGESQDNALAETINGF
jgi:hypothetical protein